MRIALVALIAGTLVSGFAAAYATTTQRMSRLSVAGDPDSPAYVSPFDKPRGSLASK